MPTFTKKDIAWQIKKLRLHNAVLINTGAMVMQGIMGTTSEIELLITPADFIRFKNFHNLKHCSEHTFQLGDITLHRTLSVMPKHEYIDDVKVVLKRLLQEQLEAKREANDTGMKFALEAFILKSKIKK